MRYLRPSSVAVLFVCATSLVLGTATARDDCPPIPLPEPPPAVLYMWGSEGSAPEQFSYPYGIAVDSAGNVWVTDLWNHRVKKFTPDGTLLEVFGGYGTGDTQFIAPAQIAFDAAGNWYVTERHRVKMFDASGNFIRKWGQQGSGDGEFGIPDGIGVGPQGNVYVVDHDNNRVQKFTPEGEYITQWTHQRMYHPHGLAITDDTIYIAGGGRSNVLEFELDGTHVQVFGDYGTVENCAEGGEFWHTVGLALSPDGDLFVSDSFNYRIQQFSSSLSFLTLWGVEGSDPGEFSHPGPIHVAIAADGKIYVTDSGNDRVQAFLPADPIPTVQSSWGSMKGAFRNP